MNTTTPSLSQALTFITGVVGKLNPKETSAFVSGFVGEAIRVRFPDRPDIADFVDDIGRQD